MDVGQYQISTLHPSASLSTITLDDLLLPLLLTPPTFLPSIPLAPLRLDPPRRRYLVANQLCSNGLVEVVDESMFRLETEFEDGLEEADLAGNRGGSE